MAIYSLLDCDNESWGLLNVTSTPFTESETELVITGIAEKRYQSDDLVSSDDLFVDIIDDLREINITAERVFINKINMV